ncbi:HAMP domain-containing sensor histidine kinase [Clostridiaceae bacterium 35-E11]
MSANYIFEKGKRIEAISMKLLELIVLKKQDFHMKSVSAKDFFDQIQELMALVFKKENIDFPVSVKYFQLLIEPDLMKTVCINLLDNTRKAVSSTKGRVVISGKPCPNGYIIQICDNGKGMEEAELSRITEAFYMADQSRAVDLNLSFVRYA